MKQTIFINNRKITLDPSQLIQSGGEGMVFGLGDTAVKRYHLPRPQQKAKLDQLIRMFLPGNILAPCATVQDKKGQTVGFQMPKLPTGALPFKQFANPIYWRKNKLQTQEIIQYFLQAHQTITQLHHNQVIIGDLNDQNLFFWPASSPPTSFFIDVDSYQFAQYPCPVANLTFLDPNLYHISDFSRTPTFTPNTDWYAYFVLLIKSLLQVHPYGGTHKRHKSLPARAQAGITILDPSVTYPANARHPESLSDSLLHHLHLVFAQGRRQPLPLDLLTGYANDLTHCPQCGLAYPYQRPSCPACRHQTMVAQPTGDQLRQLLQVDGFIEHITVLPNGRILVIIYSNNTYKLLRLGIGGTADAMVLFSGQPRFRCAIFANHLVVNPSQSKQLLILDIGGTQPQQVTILETADFRGTAVFATTRNHLYRIAGNWIMRGTFQHGLYVEDALTTAHKAQTQFFGSPANDIIAGYYRLFAQTNYFLLDQYGASYDIPLPDLPPGASLPETAVAFGQNNVAILRKVGLNGHYTGYTHIADHKGRLLYTHQNPGDTFDGLVHHYPYASIPQSGLRPLPPSLSIDEQTRIYQHPQGLLLLKPDQSLWFLPT